MNIGINLLNNWPIAIKFESRKSETPQLRDEYRAYKILSGCGNNLWNIILLLLLLLYKMMLNKNK